MESASTKEHGLARAWVPVLVTERVLALGHESAFRLAEESVEEKGEGSEDVSVSKLGGA
jgi:hypothetical protein